MVDEGESNLIYGLELQGRALAAVVADNENISFIVGTQSLKSDNFVYKVSLDEDSGQLNKRVLKHSGGEVWALDPSPTEPDTFLSTYGEKTATSWRKTTAVWKMPSNKSSQDLEEGSVPAVELVSHLSQVCGEGEMVGSWFQPNDASKVALIVGDKVSLIDLGQGAQPSKVWNSQHTVRGQTRIETAKWNPHRSCHQISTVCGSQIISWDSRTGDKAWNINVNSGCAVRSLDFNPNKQYFLASGGDDGSVSVWDCRQTSQGPLSTARQHSHWVWSVRYNTFHDQLLLSAGSDSRVLLHSQASLSSEPFRQELDDEENTNKQEKILDDGVLQTFYDHEDSVYTAEWSAADPWTFASLSYDGRLVLGHVPKAVKYRILSLS